MGSGSNLGRSLRIERVRVKGERGRRRDAPAMYSRGGGRPEVANLGLPGVDSSGAGVWKHLHGTRDLQVALVKLGEVWSGGFVGGGGPA